MDPELEARLRALEAVEDPAERFRLAGDLIEDNRMTMEQARIVRQEAIAEMRRLGLSYGKIGAALGISRARAESIHKGRGNTDHDRPATSSSE